METSYNYTCPNCSQECAVGESLTGQNVVCPHCSQEFFATPPDVNSQIIVPEKLPFFKSGRKKMLDEHLQALIADGEMSESDHDILKRTAIMLGLSEKDLSAVVAASFFNEFSIIQKRIEKAWQLTDQDLEEIEALKKKHGVNLQLEGTAALFRTVYLLEVKRQLPPPLSTDLMLDPDEYAYHGVASSWHQARVHNRGYSGLSMSVPTGISGVRFRFGQYTPNRVEEITPLASGILWATSKRLIFQGDSRNTTVDYRRIIDAAIFSDCLKIEKARGKPDYFRLQGENLASARLITALIGSFRL